MKATCSLLLLFISLLSLAQTKEQIQIQNTEQFKMWQKEFNTGYKFFNSKDFEPALLHFNKAVLYAPELGEVLPYSLINSNYFLALTLNQLDRIKEAEDYFEKTYSLAEKLIPRNQSFEFEVQGNIAYMKARNEEYKDAIEYFIPLISQMESASLNKSDTYAVNLGMLGEVYYTLENFEQAINYFNKSISVFEVNKANSEFLGRIYTFLGVCYYHNGSYNAADESYSKAVTVLKSLGLEKTVIYAKLLSYIAALEQLNGRYDMSRNLHVMAIGTLSDLEMSNTVEFAESLLLFASYLKEIGEFELSLKNIVKSKGIYSKNFPEEHLRLADIVMLQAEVLLNLGELDKALELSTKAKDIYINEDQEMHAGFGKSLNVLGMCYQALGDFKNAEFSLEKAKEIIAQTLHDKHPDYGKVLINLGNAYSALNKDNLAVEQLNSAIDVVADSIGTDNVTYGQLCIMLSKLLFKNNILGNHEALVERALRIFEKTLGIDNPYYSSAALFKSLILTNKGDYNAALKICENIKENIAKSLGKDNELYFDALFFTARNYHLAKNYQEAFINYRTLNALRIKQIKKVFTFRDKEDKKKYLDNIKYWFSVYTRMAVQQESKNIDILEETLNNQLILKGLLLNSSKDIFSQLQTINDDEVNLKIQSYRKLTTLETRIKNNPVSSKDLKYSEILSEKKVIETELVKIYAKVFGFTLNFDKDWNDSRGAIQDKEIVIEFANYNTYSQLGDVKGTEYIAYVFNKNSETPKLIKLFNEEDLKTILNAKTPNQLYKTRGSQAKNILANADVYELVWKPLESHLKGFETIYYSPVGILNQVPFAALSKEGELLSNKYDLVQLSSTSLLVELNEEPKQDNSLFIGGINYDFTQEGEGEKSKSNKLGFLKSTRGNRNLGETWNYLPGTMTEIKSVQKLFKKKKKNFNVITSSEASENVFKSLSGNSPSVLHIATHGFFFENQKKENRNLLELTKQSIYRTSEDPLMRSGLILAGANHAWKNGEYFENDGILTAADIANLDLSNTDMVVLSACNTGLGDIDGSEGVYGLQRAFKMAGVDIIVMSLWEVPDKETAEFMKLFYSNWLGRMKVREAFNTTQRTMSAKYKDSPEKWAAFVLFE